jgi:hypothetical protein
VCFAALTAIAAAGSTLSQAREARAQSCHDGLPTRQGESQYELFTFSEYADFSTSRYTGHFETWGLLARWTEKWGSLSGTARAHFLSSNGRTHHGAGDTTLAGRIGLATLHHQQATLDVSVQLALHIPTADAGQQLGMGHWMSSQGIETSVAMAPVQAALRVAYGHAWQGEHGAHGHHHHRGAGPVVNPMNARELESALDVQLESPLPWLGLRATIDHAAPLSADGEPRGVLGLGVLAKLQTLTSGIEIHKPWRGQPFETKLRLFVGFQL